MTPDELAALAASSAPAVGPNTGSVSAPFVRSDASRLIFLGVAIQMIGNLTTAVQDANGVMTTLPSYSLSGSAVTKEISGDTNLAQGRWVAGTVTSSSGALTLTGTDNSAYHYVAYNNLSALPLSGASTCDSGTFTAPTWIGGMPAVPPYTAAVSGSASVAFAPAGATFSGALNVAQGANTGSVSLNGSIATVTNLAITGSFLGGGTGAEVALGTDGGTGQRVVVGYTATLTNGARYHGVGYFRCH